MSNQTSRNQHGSQRFHGAFTGGFSAGYHNTVGSIEGFQPKSFTSSRKSKIESSRFSHRAEDYMDEEDFGEFGIAPKKIRVSCNYSDLPPAQGSSSSWKVKRTNPVVSIGEKILTHSTKPFLLNRYDVDCLVEVLNRYLKEDSSNFHGLGYKPLKPQSCSSISYHGTGFSNPLTATMKDGQRLKIVGEAFGSGIQDDDDELLDHFDTHGYDDKKLYRDTKTKPQTNEHCAHDYSRTSSHYEDDLLPGFTLAKRNNVIGICDTPSLDYKPPDIPDSWVPPVRKFELKQNKRDAMSEANLKEFKLGQLDKKFTLGPSSKLKDTECKAGLISYSEFKADNINQQEENTTTNSEKPESAFMKRTETDWFPCSLLCKHFNVPNPHPLGAGPSSAQSNKEELKRSVTEKDQERAIDIGPVPLEFRKLVFNVTFTKQEDCVILESTPDHENAPQVEIVQPIRFELVSTEKPSNINKQSITPQQLESSESESDVVIVGPVCKKPEVIVISSSSSSSSIDHSDTETCEKKTEDLYGPPIPSTLRASHSCNRKKKSKKKKKKKKDKKRSRSKR